MPVRGTVAIFSTVTALVLVLSFRTPDTSKPQAPIAVLPSPSQSGPGAGASPDSSSPPAYISSPSPSPASASGRYKDGQFTGQDVPTEFGDNQVKVIISGGRITDVQAVQLPFDRPRSAYISQVAGPMLHDEAIQAQSAQIDAISGATYTSEAYAQSLQSALDQSR